MNILQLSTMDATGGAARIAWYLMHGYRRRGHGSWMAVGERSRDDAGVFVVPNDARRNPWTRAWRAAQARLGERRHPWLWRLSHWLASAGEPRRFLERKRGIEDFRFPGTRRILALAPGAPDVLHAHNLHGGYFDLRELAPMSRRVPTVLTLHDEWLFTGHCSYAVECQRWEEGCGACPDLARYQPVEWDATARNLRRKEKIYRESRLYVATPSQWLLDRAGRSILQKGVVEGRVVRNGVDLEHFHPGDRMEARAALGLPQEAGVVLFVGHGGRDNPYKNQAMVEEAVRIAAAAPGEAPLVALCLGREGEPERHGRLALRFLPYQDDLSVVASYYRAADLYCHAAHADNYPNVILEAMACGIPVVATAVGGIPEQVEEEATGRLVPAGDAAAMAAAIGELLADESRRTAMGELAAERTHALHGLERQVGEYLSWFGEIVEETSRDRG